MIHILLPENREDQPPRRDRLPPLDRPSLVTIHDLPNRDGVEIYGVDSGQAYKTWFWRPRNGA